MNVLQFPPQRTYSGLTVRTCEERDGRWRWRLVDPGDDGTWSSRDYPTLDAAFEGAKQVIEETEA